MSTIRAMATERRLDDIGRAAGWDGTARRQALAAFLDAEIAAGRVDPARLRRFLAARAGLECADCSSPRASRRHGGGTYCDACYHERSVEALYETLYEATAAPAAAG